MTVQSRDDSPAGLYKAYKNKVYNLAYRMTGDRDISEDIVQETFVRVLQHYKTFKGQSRVYTWIFSIAKNICYQHFNRTKRSSHQALEQVIRLAGKNGLGEPLDAMHRKNYALQVKEGCLLGLLRCLSFQQRLAFILNVLFDVPFDEVARIIGKSRNSVRILAHRARKNILSFLCRHCSLYRENNRCHCSHLVSFSLKQGWIDPIPVKFIHTVETELADLKKEIQLYQSLPERTLRPGFDRKMGDMLKKRDLLIFSRGKVK